jgi:hypothetical protein
MLAALVGTAGDLLLVAVPRVRRQSVAEDALSVADARRGRVGTQPAGIESTAST